MREAMFIKRNAEKWQRWREVPAADPDETADRFVSLMDDLAYSKTFYPRSKVTAWINGLASSLYQNIYRNRRESYARLFDFWKYDLPLTFYRHRRVLIFTTVLFAAFTAIGYFSSANDPDFVRGIMGDSYVDLTEENIAKGDPFGIYKDDNQFSMFVRIAYNNIGVSFKLFMGGFSLGIFTIMGMWSNGIMLGSFHHMFVAHGLGMQSILVVWIHGTIEILSVILAGGAGFILANGIIFPGTFTRGAAFRRSAKDAGKLLVCLIPFFLIAAVLESYITHLMSRGFESGGKVGMPVWVSVLILAVSFIFMIGYFVVRPIRLHRAGFSLTDKRALSRMKVNA